MNLKKITVPEIVRMKKDGGKIAALTAYDYLMAKILDQAGIDIILVGDSVGMVVAGHSSTLPVTLEQILYHTQAVSRGVTRALLVSDMPFLSFQVSEAQTIENAGRLMKEGNAEAVKIEGGEPVAGVISKLVDFGIPVMGHLGLTPQSFHKFGGFKVQGREEAAAGKLLQDAELLEKAGVFSIVLEKVPASLAKRVSEALHIPTIGIGAGVGCDGQILVSHDMLGLYEDFHPKFARRYAELADEMKSAFKQYIDDVKSARFPSDDESYF
ncbi:3-methyl-2-oxobutanoate hydroxymethyltransferase [bacterium BMS3Abin05]|nr:3-methyl-2-oxobutanoate hydroxymethyltransferase [bacterium BMS3Abin05]GBE27214.1 3-methyl-2-oxobutanoate hydroxymethyltransferase [bacterium BMS3Bbin03]